MDHLDTDLGTLLFLVVGTKQPLDDGIGDMNTRYVVSHPGRGPTTV